MWDVIVVGGGPAGCRCAATLARESWRVLIVDAKRSSKPALADTVAPDVGRRLARWLPAVVRRDGVVLKSRGLLSLWETEAPSVTDYELECCGPGYTVHRPALDRLLLDQAAVDGAVVRRGWRCVRLQAGEVTLAAGVEFATPDGIRLDQTRLVIVASGRAGITGLPTRNYVDRQLAFATVIEGAETHDLLWVERVKDGWWYLTRVSAGSAQVVFVSERGLLPQHGGPLHQRFSDALASTRLIRTAFSSRPSIEHVSTYDARASAPAMPCSSHVLLVGDAAGSVDPLSGLGWRRALESADEIAERANDYLRGSRQIDSVGRHQDNAAWFAAHVVQRRTMLERGSPANPND